MAKPTGDMPETIMSDRGRPLRRDVRAFTVRYKGRTRTVDAPGWYPDDPEDWSDGVFVGADFEVTDAALRDLKEEVDGILAPATVRRIRKKLKLTQSEASEYIGGGGKAFQKYESGAVEPSTAVCNLLLLLDRHPELLEELRQFRTRPTAA